eukprot:m.27468 g.27468  ORF g.27468 m.27468 type:complete len:652 (-) comp5942_c0_seq1:154-2109(-)
MPKVKQETEPQVNRDGDRDGVDENTLLFSPTSPATDLPLLGLPLSQAAQNTSQILRNRITTSSTISVVTKCGASATVKATLSKGCLIYKKTTAKVSKSVAGILLKRWKPMYYTRSLILCENVSYAMLVNVVPDATSTNTEYKDGYLVHMLFSRESEMLEWFRMIASTMNISTIEPFMVDPDHVTISRKIGAGSFGKVYEGEMDGLKVAIKTQRAFEQDGDTVAEFVNEAALLASLRHECLTSLFGVYVTETEYQGFPVLDLVLVIELCEGGTLTSHIERLTTKEFQMQRHEAVHLMHDLFAGLNYLHHHKVVHRDLKPDNVLLTADSKVKICDFGQAKNVSGSSGSRQMTANTRGTLLWRAPEMMTGLETGKSISRMTDYDTSVDVYSAGIIIWQMIYLEEPYKDIENTFDVEVGVSSGTLRPPTEKFKDFPRVYNIITSCWNQDPSNRPCALEVAVRLEDAALFSKEDVTLEDEEDIINLVSAHCLKSNQLFSDEGNSEMMFRFGGETLAPLSGEGEEVAETDVGAERTKLKLNLIQKEVSLFRTHTNAQLSIASLVEAMRQPDIGIFLATRTFFGQEPCNCFAGVQIRDWLEKHAGMAKKKAREIAMIIKDAGVVEPCSRGFTLSLRCYYKWSEGKMLRDGLIQLFRYA